ncbi:MAG: hypothetical protein Q9219_005970 [cf. Caloplaca sp. 3 TL-2023]
MAVSDTPGTYSGNSSHISNGNDLDDFSVENTFLAPLRKENNLVSPLRHGRSIGIRTPRFRAPFGDRRNLPNASVQGEFTPLLKSVARKNLRMGKSQGVPETPVFLKKGYKSADSSALPYATPSAYGENTASSLGVTEDGLPEPPIASSSAQATPLAAVPKKNAEGVLTEQGNVLTLREQENVINKIEKENFGLKLKIHFLEDSLRKSGPGFNETALKENTELKVDKITMQKELARARKTLERTEREVEDFRKQLQNVHDQTRRQHSDEQLIEELKSLKQKITSKDAQIQKLRDDLGHADQENLEIEKLRGDVDDLKFDIREKNRLLDDREDEIEALKERTKKDAEDLAEASEKVDSERKYIEELEQGHQTSADRLAHLDDVLGELADAQGQIQDLKQGVDQAETQAKGLEAELQETCEAKAKLRDELFNRSFSSKGLTRQYEEKLQRLQEEAAELKDKGSKAEHEAQKEIRRLRTENGELQQNFDIIDQKSKSLTIQLQELTQNLERKSEEKELLHARHDALTNESKNLQRDLTRSQANAKELEADLEAERSHGLENDRQLREDAEDEIRQLSDEMKNLQRELDEKDSQQAAQRDLWESQRRGLESERDRANEQSAGLQRTIGKLQETEGTLSGQEHKLQEALESEQQRHKTQEASLKRDLDELEADVNEKRKQLAESRSELARVKEELRISKRDRVTLEEKVQALEDELNVLQDSLDEEAARTKDEMYANRQESESLRCQLHSAKQEIGRVELALTAVRTELKLYQDGLKDDDGSREQLNNQLQNVKLEVQRLRAEEQSLQDRLANNNLEIHGLSSSLEKVEAERDRFKTQFKQAEVEVNRTSVQDQDKSEFEKAKLKLEFETSRMRVERDALQEKNEAVEKELEEEMQRASIEEVRLHDEITELGRKISSLEMKDKELAAARHRIKYLEDQGRKFEDRVTRYHDGDFTDTELSDLRKDLSAARQRETEHLQRESTQREIVRDLKRKVVHLERQVHEAELAKIGIDSPKSSVGGSSQKTEIAELRSQLSDAHQQLKDLRSRSRDTEKELRRKLDGAEREYQANMVNSEQEREQLENEISILRHDQESEQSKFSSAEKTISRLRNRIQGLESSLRDARNLTIGDRTMADERKDLHEMLKDAKLEAEELRLQISTSESALKTAAAREQGMHAHIQRVREERTHQRKKSSALLTELDTLQSRYERAVENLSQQQKAWEAERKAINSRVRFPNTSVSEDRGGEEAEELQLVVQENEKRHTSEIHGMATQIQWLRWKLEREADFRNCLVFEKCYLSTQIKMYEACNKLDLAMMKKNFGIDAKQFDPEPVKKPHLRTYAILVVFTLRCKRYADEWTEQKKVKGALNKALEEARRGALRKRIEAAGR